MFGQCILELTLVQPLIKNNTGSLLATVSMLQVGPTFVGQHGSGKIAPVAQLCFVGLWSSQTNTTLRIKISVPLLFLLAYTTDMN